MEIKRLTGKPKCKYLWHRYNDISLKYIINIPTVFLLLCFPLTSLSLIDCNTCICRIKESYFRKSYGGFSLLIDIYHNYEVMFVHSLNWSGFKEDDEAFKSEFSEF